MLRKTLFVLGVIVLIIALGMVAMARELAKADKIMSAIEVNPAGITEVLQTLADGQYQGEINPSRFVGATVRVTVKNHVITSIELVEHNCLRGKPAEALTDEVVAHQTLAIDSISGATASSKVILKAIENAIRGEK